MLVGYIDLPSFCAVISLPIRGSELGSVNKDPNKENQKWKVHGFGNRQFLIRS